MRPEALPAVLLLFVPPREAPYPQVRGERGAAVGWVFGGCLEGEALPSRGPGSSRHRLRCRMAQRLVPRKGREAAGTVVSCGGRLWSTGGLLNGPRGWACTSA